MSKDKKKASALRAVLSVAAVVLLAAEIIASGFFLTSAKRMAKEEIVKITGDGRAQFEAAVSRTKSSALESIYELPKVYTLPVSNSPAPKPDEAGFSSMPDDGRGTYNGGKIETYEDETIRVEVWKEFHENSIFNFADIKIAHPSQFIHALSDDDFYSPNRYKPVVMARQKNAVVAMTGDFCKYRNSGVNIHNRKLYRNKPQIREVLFVDSESNFHTMKGSLMESSGILNDYDIIFSLSFGPAVVENGKARSRKNIGYYTLGNPWELEPRACVGQVGKLHYLFCTVDGRDKGSKGVNVIQVGKVMEEKNCQTAYMLDGGQTATLMFHGEVYNKVAYGGQREVSDIIYCATAIPDGEGQ